MRGRTHAEGRVWVPPAARRRATRATATNENDDANDDADVAFAFDAESLDEAISLDRGGGVEGAEVWLSSATLVVLPPVLISHWLEQIRSSHVASRGGRYVASFNDSRRRRRREARRRRTGSFAKSTAAPTPIDACSASRERLVIDAERVDARRGGFFHAAPASSHAEGGCSSRHAPRARHAPTTRLAVQTAYVNRARVLALVGTWCSSP